MARVLLLLLGILVFLFGGLLALALLLWWLLTRSPKKQKADAIEIELPRPAAAALSAEEASVAPEPAQPAVVESQPAEEAAKPDDLKRIEGIGPKIASVLQAAGITTFAQLAATEPGRIEQILEARDPRLRRLANPATWPEQARLAAADEWEALAALQGELKGGRRA
jgi:predicted flap endonuclease-1-like 5' DNA nuclease